MFYTLHCLFIVLVSFYIFFIYGLEHIKNPQSAFLICVAMFTKICSRVNVINIMSIKEMPAISFSPSSGLEIFIL